MASPQVIDLLSLFVKVAPKPFFDQVCERLNIKFGSGIYNVAVISWLVILQRLLARKNLMTAVQSLRLGQADQLLGTSKRVREGNISPQPRLFLPSPAEVA